MSYIVCKASNSDGGYYYNGNDPAYGLAENAQVYNSESVAANVAESLSSSEEHWYLDEDVAKSGNPSTPPPRPRP